MKAAGGRILRGGVYKPRTSPYSFQGLGREGPEILAEARAETGLPIVTEVLEPRLVEKVGAVADVLQVGSRSMQNFGSSSFSPEFLIARTGIRLKACGLRRLGVCWYWVRGDEIEGPLLQGGRFGDLGE